MYSGNQCTICDRPEMKSLLHPLFAALLVHLFHRCSPKDLHGPVRRTQFVTDSAPEDPWYKLFNERLYYRMFEGNCVTSGCPTSVASALAPPAPPRPSLWWDPTSRQRPPPQVPTGGFRRRSRPCCRRETQVGNSAINSFASQNSRCTIKNTEKLLYWRNTF